MVKYDDVDYHEDTAQAEDAGWHVAHYLAWMIRKGLMQRDELERAAADPRVVSSVPATELLDLVFDGQLTDDFMTEEGMRFSDACYDAYLDALDSALAGGDPDRVIDDASSYDIVARVLDALYADWSRSPTMVRGDDDPELMAAWGPDPAFTSLSLLIDRSFPDDSVPHAEPELERVIPPKVGPVGLRTMSTPIDAWWSLSGEPIDGQHRAELADASVAFGMGRRSSSTVMITVYRVPGVDSGRLTALLGGAQFPDGVLPPPTQLRGGRSVHIERGPDEPESFDTVVFGADGALVVIMAPHQHITSAIDEVDRRLERI